MKTATTMNKCLLVGVTGLILAGWASAGTIEFTAEEGYFSGNLWQQNPAGGYDWSTITDYAVDINGGGTLSANTASNAYCFPARYSQPILVAPRRPLSAYVDFRFTGLDVQTPAASNSDRQGVASINFGLNQNWGGIFGGTIGTFEWQPGGTYGFQLSTPPGLSGTFAPEALGLTSAGGTVSDLLRLSLTATVAESGNSTYLFELANLDGGTNIISVTGSIDLTSHANLFLSLSGSASPRSAASWTAERIHIEDPPPKCTLFAVK